MADVMSRNKLARFDHHSRNRHCVPVQVLSQGMCRVSLHPVDAPWANLWEAGCNTFTPATHVRHQPTLWFAFFVTEAAIDPSVRAHATVLARMFGDRYVAALVTRNGENLRRHTICPETKAGGKFVFLDALRPTCAATFATFAPLDH